MFGDTSNQGTLIALASFSQDKMLNMLRSAALLSPIAYMGQMSSFLVRCAADIFLAEVRIENLFSNLLVLVFKVFFFMIFLLLMHNFLLLQELKWLGLNEFNPRG